jgi:S-adenosylmethionine synthetase
VSYAIGIAKPLSIRVDTFGTGKVGEDKLTDAVSRVFDLRPAAIIKDLDLKRPIYEKTAYHGHFGRPDFPWEQTSRKDALCAALGVPAKA